MAFRALPPPEVLRQLLRYEPDTGKLFWLARGSEWFQDGPRTAIHNCAKWNGHYAGKEAFTSVSDFGYKIGSILGVNFPAHRVIWAMQTGYPPKHTIDHIDGDEGNNRWGNLREATHSQNCQNRRISTTNTSGIKGVSWHKNMKKWTANIKANGKQHYLGAFNTPEEAQAAYASASSNIHGEFGRLD